MKTFLDSGVFFPHGSQKSVLRLRTTIVKESGFLEKEFLYNFFFETERGCFGFAGKMCRLGLRKCILRVHRIILRDGFQLKFFPFTSSF